MKEKRIRQYRDLEPGDVFSIPHERDDRRYMKLADSHSINIDNGEDCIPTVSTRCLYHYSIDVNNNIFRRKA